MSIHSEDAVLPSQQVQKLANDISAMYSERKVISASLGHIQSLILTNPEILRSNLQSRPDLENILDSALTGCILVFSVLDDEVQTLHRNVTYIGTRVAQLWEEGTMTDLLTQIRGQQTALSLLIQALQMLVSCLRKAALHANIIQGSMLEVRNLLQNNNTVLQQVGKGRTVKE